MTRNTVVRRFAPLEACPIIFSEYAAALGQRKLVFADLPAWESWAYDMVKRPIVGVIVTIPFTDKITKYRETNERYTVQKHVSPNVWFAYQNLRNQCGTYALLHLLNNISENRHITNDSIFRHIRRQTLHASPQERGIVINNTKQVHELHAKFGRKGQSAVSNEHEVASHYVTFVVVDGDLYELDGRLNFPINHGKTAPHDLLLRVGVIMREEVFVIEPNIIRFTSIVASLDD